MPKIKVKKIVNTGELINLYLDGKIGEGTYANKEGAQVTIYERDGYLDTKLYGDETDLFEAEIEQEIDENTEIKNLIEVCAKGSSSYIYKHNATRSIGSILHENDRQGDKTLAFYIMQDDMTMQLIWKDGEFVV